VWWLFGQVWLLCAVSFLLGSLLTWLLFAVSARRHARAARAGPEWMPAPAWGASEPSDTGSEERPPPPPAGPPADPALTALDTRDRRPPARLGTAASGALDVLGVRGRPEPGGDEQRTPAIPEEAGPVEGVGPGGRPEEREPPPAR
jgi:hypothetical protein